MSFPETFYRPRVVFAPDDKTVSDASGQTDSESPKLHGIDFDDRATWNKVVRVVHELEKYNAHEHATRILGLPEYTTRDEIETYIDDQDNIYLARHFGLPEDSPEEVIREHLQQEDDERYRAHARALGLPGDATGDEIDERERMLSANNLGLPENTPWDDIWRTEKEQKRKIIFEALGILEDDKTWDWEEVLRRALCVSGVRLTAEDYIKRIQEVRQWHIEQLVNERG